MANKKSPTIPTRNELGFIRNVKAHYKYGTGKTLYLSDETYVDVLVAYRAGKGPYETAKLLAENPSLAVWDGLDYQQRYKEIRNEKMHYLQPRL